MYAGCPECPDSGINKSLLCVTLDYTKRSNFGSNNSILTCATVRPAFSHRSSVVLVGLTKILSFESAYNTLKYPSPETGMSSKLFEPKKMDALFTVTTKSAGHCIKLYFSSLSLLLKPESMASMKEDNGDDSSLWEDKS